MLVCLSLFVCFVLFVVCLIVWLVFVVCCLLFVFPSEGCRRALFQMLCHLVWRVYASFSTTCDRNRTHPPKGAEARPNGKNARSSAPAPHWIPASQIIRTPVQAQSRSTGSTPAKRYEHPFKCTRAALCPCKTRSSAPAQHCSPASQTVRTPVQAHPRCTVFPARQMVRTPV